MEVRGDVPGNVTMLPQLLLEQGHDAGTGVGEALTDKQRELQEFYATYDVWTGIRTAITLALFFLFTVSVILYKSRCKKSKPFDVYPSLEDVPERPLDYCDFWCSNPFSSEVAVKRGGVGRCYEEGRVGMGSAPLPPRGSVGSYASLANSFRVKSLPGSVMAINWSRMSSYEKEDASCSSGYQVRSDFLRVPGLRLQSTSSTETYSANASSSDAPLDSPAALLGVPGSRARPLLQLGGMDWDSDHATAEWLQTIDINVIQPTPNISPCGSVRSVSDQAGVIDHHGSFHTLSHKAVDEDGKSLCSDSVFFDGSGSSCDDARSFRSTPRSSRRATQPNIYYTGSTSQNTGKQLLGLPMNTNLSGSTEKLTIQRPDPSRLAPDNSLQATSSNEVDSQMVSFKVPNIRRTLSATNEEVRHSLKVKKYSPMKRAESETQAVKRSDSSISRQDSNGSTSSTDEATESVSFHLMVPQLSIDIPSQEVSRASSPSMSPTPPQTPPVPRSNGRGRQGTADGRGVLRRQLAKDYTQPCQQLPTYPEEEEPTLVTSYDFISIKPPPGYRDLSPVPPLSISPVPSSPSPYLMSSPGPYSPLSYPLSPLYTDIFTLPHPTSPIPPPPSPLYSRGAAVDDRSPGTSRRVRSSHRTPSPLAVPSSPLPRSHSPLVRTDPPIEQVMSASVGPGIRKIVSDASKASENAPSESDTKKVCRHESMAAMTRLSFDVPDPVEDVDVHETSC
ncbi:flocculation protein FLO11 [Hyalella azteca]|uniref:Flocculation protein FLO11 n=1 Tax=Hyalella azteca TaxID=294128 RepID=A0A8B7P0N6_HYAAZ|nr:flocculation protein FLO11 [Hyalella azteca]